MFFKKNDPNNTCDNYKKKHEEDLVRIQCLKEVISDIQGKNIRLVRENRALNKQIEQIKNSMEEEQGVFSYAQPENLSFGNYKTVYVRRPASDGSQENPEVVFEQEKTDSLAESIKENGIMQPIVVSQMNEDQFLSKRHRNACCGS